MNTIILTILCVLVVIDIITTRQSYVKARTTHKVEKRNSYILRAIESDIRTVTDYIMDKQKLDKIKKTCHITTKGVQADEWKSVLEKELNKSRTIIPMNINYTNIESEIDDFDPIEQN